MKKVLLSIICAFVAFALNAQVTDDFSDYTVGGKLAEQAQAMGRDYWTTWSNSPGGTEDGVIAEVGGSKALSLVSGNDQTLLLGQKTSGVWDFSMKMYIPSNKIAYFNILSAFSGSQSTWALQVYFNKEGTTPGAGTMAAGGDEAASFTFDHDAWTDIKVTIDLDTDNAKIYINGDLIYEWQYSLGTFGAGCQRVIDAMNIYCESANWNFYIDDVEFKPVSNTLFETNFDDLSAGDYVAQTYPEWWRTWSDTPATAEDGLITTEQAATTPNSAKLAYGTDLLFWPGLKTTGMYTIDFDMYIPGTVPAYFNLLQSFTGDQNGLWAIGIYFNITDATNFPATGTYIQQDGELTNFTAPSNTWFPVSFMVDLDNDIATISINGTQLLEWQFSLQESGGAGLRQLEAADFFPPLSGSTYYIDNFVFAGVGGGAPALNLNVTSINEVLKAGQTISKEITITNSGSSIGDYAAWINLDIDDKGGEKDNYTLTYSSDLEGSVFVNGGDTPLMEFAAKYPLSYYCDMVGTYITKISYFLPGQPYDNRLTARVYRGSSYNNTGEILTETTTTNPIVASWNEFSLPEPVLLDGSDIWVAFEAIQATGNTEGLMATDAGIAVENSDWTRSNGGSWHQLHITQPELANGNFMIKAFTEGNVAPGCWVLLSGDTYGSLLSGDAATFEVNLDTEGLEEITYEATIYIATNDVEHELFEIPVSLTVEPIGIDETTANSTIAKIYPVPATGMVTIESSENINNIQVINNIGQVIYHAKVENTQTTFNAANFNTGVYFVRIDTNIGLQTVKLIVQ